MEAASSPSEELIQGWITQYGRVATFTHGDVEYWFREVTRREYKLVLNIPDELEREEQIVETCLLWPPGWTIAAHLDNPAGEISVLATEIRSISGCIDLKITIEAQRAIAESEIEAQMEATIEHVFSGGGNFRRYLDWSYDQLFEAYARAEWVAVNLLGKQVATQQQPAKARKRGLADPRLTEAAAGNPSLPSEIDFDSTPMALRPIGDIAKLAAVTARKNAMRQVWDGKTPPKT